MHCDRIATSQPPPAPKANGWPMLGSAHWALPYGPPFWCVGEGSKVYKVIWCVVFVSIVKASSQPGPSQLASRWASFIPASMTMNVMCMSHDIMGHHRSWTQKLRKIMIIIHFIMHACAQAMTIWPHFDTHWNHGMKYIIHHASAQNFTTEITQKYT